MARFRTIRFLLCAGIILPLLLSVGCAERVDRSTKGEIVPLLRAHAHNDYEHRRPLLDALDHGFMSVEADVFRVGDTLLVGHTSAALQPQRTLQSLYLDPLAARCELYGGRVYPSQQPGTEFILLIDVKSDAESTYTLLDDTLRHYESILTSVHAGKVQPGPIRVVISGNRAIETITAQTDRYAGIDGRLADLESDMPASLMPMISGAWGSVFRWTGAGKMPADELTSLKAIVQKAHEHHRLLRFWASPERRSVWLVLYDAHVDLINTDNLDGLRSFLLQQSH